MLVFALLFFEFGLVQLTSSLSLSVFGIFKELVTILLAAATLGDVLSLDLFLGDALDSDANPPPLNVTLPTLPSPLPSPSPRDRAW